MTTMDIEKNFTIGVLYCVNNALDFAEYMMSKYNWTYAEFKEHEKKYCETT